MHQQIFGLHKLYKKIMDSNSIQSISATEYYQLQYKYNEVYSVFFLLAGGSVWGKNYKLLFILQGYSFQNYFLDITRADATDESSNDTIRG